MKKIIFTDLDGTFLNHDDYRFDDAKESLHKIAKQAIPLIFTTSKTKSEVLALQKNVGINEPFITENGAALYIPQGYNAFDFSHYEVQNGYHVIPFGSPYKKILDFYNDYKEEFLMWGFSEMSTKDIMHYTHLTKEEASLCMQREYTEPFMLEDDSFLPFLEQKAKCNEIKIVQGGRFYHLMSMHQDKGIAVQTTIEIFSHVYNENIQSIALGDSSNDISMLEKVDIPIVIKNYKNQYLEYENTNLQKSNYQGSKGWNEMVLKYV